MSPHLNAMRDNLFHISNNFIHNFFFLQNFIFFSKIVSFCLVLFYLIKLKKNSKFFYDEQCSFSDSETILSPKLDWVHQVHTLNLGCVPTAHALRPGLCACSGYYVPAQPSICHNTVEPTVCLFSLLYATIQSSLLSACLAFYMPQYSRAYYMPAQAAVCLLRLLHGC